mmetsp:Transcript_3934/g.5849  ORF Transcript_3934/g.5849 Transcript_3934/m.5849 type:complete len:563 (+) Transcript_3934:165-1853(+)
MRLKRDGNYHNINCPEVTIGELASPSNCTSKASLQLMVGISSPKAGDKKIKVTASSPSPSIWLKRRMKTKTLTPIIGTKGCNSYRSLSSEDTMKININAYFQEIASGSSGTNNSESTKTTVLEDDNHDDVQSKTSSRWGGSASNNKRQSASVVGVEGDSRDDTQSKTGATSSRSASKNERRLDESRLKIQIEKYRDNWRESEIKKRGNEYDHDRNNERRILNFVASSKENRASTNSFMKGINSVKMHEEYKLIEAEGQSISSPLAYSQQPITQYFMQQDSHTPKSKARTTRMPRSSSEPYARSDSSCTIPHVISNEKNPLLGSMKTSYISNEAKIPENDELGNKKMRNEAFSNYRKTTLAQKDGLQKGVLRTSSSRSIGRALPSVATNSTYPSTTSESDCNSLMYKTTGVSSLTGLSGSSSGEQPPAILRVVKNGIPLGLASRPRTTASVREGTVVSALTEQSRDDTRRLQMMLEKVTQGAEERERAPLSRKWWEDESQHPSLMSPRGSPRKKDKDADFSFDELIDSVSDMIGNMCTSEFQLCSDDFDDFIGDEIDVRKQKR